MPALRQAYEYARSQLRHPYETAAVSLGLLMAEMGPRSEMVVRADDNFGRQMGRGLPSALPTPEMTGNRPVDIALNIAASGASLEVARRTTSRTELVATAAGAQILACVADAAVERSGWLSAAERTREDVGFSSIFIAWLTKSRFDKLAEAEAPQDKLRYAGQLAIGAGLILASSLIDGDSGKLDFVAHTAGALAGWVSHRLSAARSEAPQARLSANDAAA